jgi:hypothetical protein
LGPPVRGSVISADARMPSVERPSLAVRDARQGIWNF